jgi:hypothetical protein
MHLVSGFRRRNTMERALKAKVNVQLNSLHNAQIAQASTAEEHVKAIVASRISLSSFFHNVGQSFWSVDEIFVVFEYRERLKAYENKKRNMQRY